MVFYSTKSNEKVFHLPHCKIARRIRKEYKKQFATPEEARLAGYRMCNCCSLVGMRLRKEQKAVNQYCQENGVSCWLEDGQLHVHTPRSKWRIIVNGKANKLFLYHKNTYQKYEKTPALSRDITPRLLAARQLLGTWNTSSNTIFIADVRRRRPSRKRTVCVICVETHGLTSAALIITDITQISSIPSWTTSTCNRRNRYEKNDRLYVQQ